MGQKYSSPYRRESGARVITIEETKDGKVDVDDLETKLSIEHFKRGKNKISALLIGCFTAASNVTGQVNILQLQTGFQTVTLLLQNSAYQVINNVKNDGQLENSLLQLNLQRIFLGCHL